jgi:hypothetical protein
MPNVGQVFVPGGLPSYTYVPRDELNLERTVRDYLDERHRILSLSGPTKSGKTVLLRKVVENGIWVSGGHVESVNDFWALVLDNLGGYTDETKQRAEEETAGDTVTNKGGVDLKVVNVGREKGRSTRERETRTHTVGRVRPKELVARDKLLASGSVVIVDDFHYIDPKVQLGIVRGLKDLVFEGVPVILASVPHRAFDVVRVEKEMTGRVEQVPITFWEKTELGMIATLGFKALGVSAIERVISRLAEESFGSPHLMQDFCKELCKYDGVRKEASPPRSLSEPDWNPFFSARASNASKAAFDLLARGPRQRTDRLPRNLKNGTKTDIYGAVLAAIAATGPATELRYEQLRTSLKNVLADEPPQRHEVTRVLEEMSKIARTQIEGEPVVDYDVELSTLYIADPFFAYFLRWGVREEPNGNGRGQLRAEV